LALEICRAAGQDDLGAESISRMVDNSSISFDLPVAKISEALAGAGTDDQAGPGTIDLGCGEFPIAGADRDIPAWLATLDTEGLGKFEQAVHDVAFATFGQVAVTEKVLPVARPGAVEAEPNRRANAEACQVGTLRGVHMQEKREPAVFYLPPEFEVSAPAERLVEDRETNAFEPFEQRMLDTADDPRDFGIWPGVLYCADDGNRMAGIADRRQPDDAETVGRQAEFRRYQSKLSPSNPQP
jgi:hypothetical protein